MNEYRYPPVCVADFREIARQKLPKQLFEFIDGGAFNESTIHKNNEDIRRIQVKKHIFRDVSAVDTSTTIFEQKLDLPLILAPVGFAGVYASRGEVKAAKAAAKENIPFSLSTLSICSIEEVARMTKVPFWFQLYMVKDKEHCLELMQRAEAAGCPVLMLTADLPIVGVRYRDAYNGMSNGQKNLSYKAKLRNMWHFIQRPRWYYDVILRGKPMLLGNFTSAIPKMTQLSKMRQWVGNRVDAGLTWRDLEWVRDRWKGKLVVKGVMNVEDAEVAANLNVDGIVVSNHAGRHLDSMPSTISVLPAIVDAVKERLTVLIDGGIWNGLDMAKAIALGAKGCMIGRPWAFALAASGEQGVVDMIEMYKEELRNAMAQLGATKVDELDESVILRGW